MKAGMMRLSYDPPYTHYITAPSPPLKPYEPLNNRITLAKEIYRRIGSDKKPLRDTLDEAARRRFKRADSSKSFQDSLISPRQTSASFDKTDKENRKVGRQQF